MSQAAVSSSSSSSQTAAFSQPDASNKADNLATFLQNWQNSGSTQRRFGRLVRSVTSGFTLKKPTDYKPQEYFPPIRKFNLKKNKTYIN
jgi:hypothetical protein